MGLGFIYIYICFIGIQRICLKFDNWTTLVFSWASNSAKWAYQDESCMSAPGKLDLQIHFSEITGKQVRPKQWLLNKSRLQNKMGGGQKKERWQNWLQWLILPPNTATADTPQGFWMHAQRSSVVRILTPARTEISSFSLMDRAVSMKCIGIAAQNLAHQLHQLHQWGDISSQPWSLKLTPHTQ